MNLALLLFPLLAFLGLRTRYWIIIIVVVVILLLVAFFARRGR
ncbi:MAG TPA: hypothetical protein VFB58_12725 [Chloroflexota bacterium]|nr:hypothetical protein [Chloroflexota bacterium]